MTADEIEEAGKLLRSIDDMHLESSPCESCGVNLEWINRYCSICGTGNSNYDPEYVHNPTQWAEICQNEHADGWKAGLFTEDYPYCCECGKRIFSNTIPRA